MQVMSRAKRHVCRDGSQRGHGDPQNISIIYACLFYNLDNIIAFWDIVV